MRRLDTIDLRLLRVFLVLVDAGGFGLAQIALNLSASTLSTHLTDLEKRVGGSLCVRGRKGFRLTELGRTTYDAARKLFLDIEDFRSRVEAAQGRLTGRLRLGVVDGAVSSSYLGLQHALGRLLNPEVDITVDLIQATPLELERAVAEGERDLVIGPFTQRVPGVIYRPLFREPHNLYCGRGHPLFARAGGSIKRAEIEAARLSVRAYRHLDDLHRLGHSRPAATVMQMEAQLMLILTGQYIGFLPCHFAEGWARNGELAAIQPRLYGFESQHFVAYRAADATLPVLGAFLQACVYE